MVCQLPYEKLGAGSLKRQHILLNIKPTGDRRQATGTLNLSLISLIAVMTMIMIAILTVVAATLIWYEYGHDSYGIVIGKLLSHLHCTRMIHC